MADLMPEGNGKTIGLSLLVFVTSFSIYSAYLPSGLTIRTFADSDQGRQDISEGLLIGTILTLILGGGASMLSEEPLPFFSAVFGAAIAVLVYLYFVNTAHGLGSMKQQEVA